MTLHPATVVFDEVSGVVVTKGSTFFNFACNDTHQYSVQILGKPHIRQGMKVTALLEEPGNWQTLKGWIDHDSGAIIGVTSPTTILGALSFFLILLLVFFSIAIALRVRGINDHYMFAFFSVIAGLCVIGLFVQLRAARELTETLRTLREHS